MTPMPLILPPWLVCYDFQIDVIDVKTYPSTPESKGIGIGGHMVLEGRLLPLCVSWSSPDSCGDKNYLFTLPKEGEYWPKTSSALENHGQIKPDVDLADDGLTPGQTVFFLHVADPPRFKSFRIGAPCGLFLVETAISPSPKSTNSILDGSSQPIATVFRRIGSGKLCSPECVECAAALRDSPRRRVLLV
jgi:hypothetical protein